MDILNEISVDASTKDIEAGHRAVVSENNSRKTVVRFTNRKHAKKALIAGKIWGRAHHLIATFSIMKI